MSEKPKWVDMDRPRQTPSTLGFTVGNVRLVLAKRVECGFGDEWFLSGVGQEDKRLCTTDLLEAKRRARSIVLQLSMELSNAAELMVEETER